MVGGLRPFFLEARVRPHQGRKSGGKPSRWADTYTVLIDHNHALEKIPFYTKRQILLLYHRALARESKQRAARVIDTNMAGAPKKAAQAHMDSLLKQAE